MTFAALRYRLGVAVGISLSVAVVAIVVLQGGGGSGASLRLHDRRLVSIQPESATRCRVLAAATPSGQPRPMLVVLGASFTAGVGAGNPTASWAVRLAELIHWRAVTLGVPGAGYSTPGLDGLGPMWREVRLVDLRSLRPSVVIIQAGHDDVDVPQSEESTRVSGLVRRVRADVPGATLVFVTVFTQPGTDESMMLQERATDADIVSTVRQNDPHAIVIDPLVGPWNFPRADNGLHPSTRGHLLIAEHVARILARAKVPGIGRSTLAHSGVTCRRLATATS